TQGKVGAEATIGLVSVEDPRPFGLATLDANDRIIGFEEKSETNQGPGWINAGVYVLNPEVVSTIPNRRRVSLEREVFAILARQGKLRGWKHTGFWYAIGNILDDIIANRQLLQRAAVSEKTNVETMLQIAKIRQPSDIQQDCPVEITTKLAPDT